MGQYYKPASLDRNQSVVSHVYGSGLKLMEHSYLGNAFVGAVEGLLIPGGAWHRTRFAWVGDYADDAMQAFYGGSDEIEPTAHFKPKDGPGWRGDAEKIDGFPHESYPFVVNHTKGEYVDVREAEAAKSGVCAGWVIHPLPLLTASGNGRGGGDYEGTRMDEVGIWAGDVISMEASAPEGFKKRAATFIEE